MAAERSDAGRFIVHADQELPAFLELESAIKANLSVGRANDVFDEMRRVADWLQQKSDGA